MADELELDLETQDNEEIINRKDKRIKSLSEKYESSEKEKATLAEAKAKAEAELAEAKKDADFFKSFNQVSAKYQGAGEYQDKIREKANLGLDVEEATMLVLTKEGKYTPPIQPIERNNPAGGSASTSIADQADKPFDKMSKDEMRSQIQDLESRGEFKF
jgi:hypothetical protein